MTEHNRMMVIVWTTIFGLSYFSTKVLKPMNKLIGLFLAISLIISYCFILKNIGINRFGLNTKNSKRSSLSEGTVTKGEKK